MGKRTILCVAVFGIAISLGSAFGMEHRPFMIERSECKPISAAGDFLNLEGQQAEEISGLARQFDTDLMAEIQKAKAGLNDQYLEKLAQILTPEQLAKLKAVLAAEDVLVAAVDKANIDYRSALTDLFTAGMSEEAPELKTISAMLQRLPEDETQILHVMSMGDREFSKNFIDVRLNHTRAVSKIRSQISKVNVRDAAAFREWRAQEKEQLAAENEQFLKQTEEIMTADQKQLFEKALEAQKAWENARQAAEDEYTASVTKVVDGDNKRVIERHKRDVLYQTGRPLPRF